MKLFNNQFLILIYFFSVHIIYAQEKLCFNDSIFSISKDEMFFNDKIKDNKNGYIYIVDNEKYCNYYLVGENGTVFNVKNYKQIEVEKWLFYTPKGNLERVEFLYSYNTDVHLFKEYIFDDNNNIYKIIDYEKGYTICWQDAIEISKKSLGDRKLKKYNIKYFRLYRQDLNKNIHNHPDFIPIWVVWPIATTLGGEKYETSNGNNRFSRFNKRRKPIYIDGKTGAIIKKPAFFYPE